MSQFNLLPLPAPEPPEPEIPTIETCIGVAQSLGMPAEEGERFFYHHEQKGWMIGKNKIKRWRAAMAIWKLNWVKWNAPVRPKTDATKPLAVELFIANQELAEVMRQIAAITGSYSEHQSKTHQDLEKLKILRSRKSELLRVLGRVV